MIKREVYSHSTILKFSFSVSTSVFVQFCIYISCVGKRYILCCLTCILWNYKQITFA